MVCSFEGTSFFHLGLGWIGDKGGGLERYQDGICRAHARMGATVEAWVQSRSTIGKAVPYSVTAFASQEEPRSQRLENLKRIAGPALGSGRSVFISHHASVCHSLLKSIRDVPFVNQFHGPWSLESGFEGAPFWKTWVQRRHERAVYRRADRVITLSDSFKEIAIRRYGVDPDRVHVVPGGIDSLKADTGLSRGEARAKLEWDRDPELRDRIIFVCIRRLVRRVGVLELVEAVDATSKTHPQAMFLIGGTGPLKSDLSTMIAERGLERFVRLLGFVPDDILQTTYAAADYSIVPTQSLEGFGLVTLESMSTGTPAVVTPIGSLPEVMRPFSEGMVLPGHSPSEISRGIQRILDGGVSTPSPAECRQHVRDHYDWQVIAPRIMRVYLGEADSDCNFHLR